MYDIVKTIVTLLTGLCFIFNPATGRSQPKVQPENLGISINTEYSEINPVLSVDGKMLFFTRVNHPENRYGEKNSQDIWYSRLQDDHSWSEAQRLPNSVNIGRSNALLSALDDGTSYLILGRFNNAGTRWRNRGFSIVQKTGPNEWSKPRPIKVSGFAGMNRGSLVNAYMSPDRSLLVMSFSNSRQRQTMDIYLSRQTGRYRYARPIKLSFSNLIPSGHQSLEAPFLSHDKRRLYFSANLEEDPDVFNIYYARRIDAGFENWAGPIQVDENVNSPGWDSYYRIDGNEAWVYYSSVTNSFGKADIFRLRLDKEAPVVQVKGYLLYHQDQSRMLDDTTYHILVNGRRDFPGLIINKGEAFFEVQLEPGASHTLKPQMDNWAGVAAMIDLTRVQPGTVIEQNLYFAQTDVFQIRGRIIDKLTGQPVPPGLRPKVLINYQPSEAVHYELFSDAFRVLLPLGHSYTLTVDLDGYISEPLIIDATREQDFFETEVLLNVFEAP
ncbi:MAG: hypothetical protein RG741_01855 [Bacteroidales bacterium]|nr:hypothetical protein [Bacteroidales bacterium]